MQLLEAGVSHDLDTVHVAQYFLWLDAQRPEPDGTQPKLNRPGMSGDSELWEGWSHARQHEQALPG